MHTRQKKKSNCKGKDKRTNKTLKEHIVGYIKLNRKYLSSGDGDGKKNYNLLTKTIERQSLLLKNINLKIRRAYNKLAATSVLEKVLIKICGNKSVRR